jgi:quercetin dioxygenase-like cupin family protein
MEFKRNEATRNRPEGDRVLDAPYVFVELPDFIDQLKEEKAWKKNDRNGITVFKTDRLTIVVTILKKEAKIENNLTDEFVTIQLIKGKARVTTPDGDAIMKANTLVTFHPGVIHSVEAVKKCTFLITTHKG